LADFLLDRAAIARYNVRIRLGDGFRAKKKGNKMRKRERRTRKLIVFLGIVACVAITSDKADAAFTYGDLVGNAYHVTESNYSYNIAFTSNTQGYSTGGVAYHAPGQSFSYEIIGGTINIPDPEGFTAGTSYTMIDPNTFSVQQEVFPGTFEVRNYPGITDFTVFNNSATALKDYFLANGLRQSTITADGQVIHPTIPTTGEWWIENNIFYFNDPDADNVRGVDHKAYKLENDILYLQTDAGFTIDSTWEPAALAGDANGDGVVDAADYIILKRNFGQSANSGPLYGDFDNSGATDWDDLQTLIGALGGGAQTTIPEPATLALLAMGALAAIRRRRVFSALCPNGPAKTPAPPNPGTPYTFKPGGTVG